MVCKHYIFYNEQYKINDEQSPHSAYEIPISTLQEQPNRKEQNVPRTDHWKPDKADYSAISEASEALQSLIQSCSSSVKKSFKQNNQSPRSQKHTEHKKQHNQSKKNQIKELIKSLTKFLTVTKRKFIHLITESQQLHKITSNN
ncbi:Hypothetical_protein [Hexamita inflata]|uniref:Hypothetical_protein n=1 Tax=Hexamita inflata TaxID=28002 RepID=A0AA86P625_9EUKA|nr:Hypothetical protein HINF_LOCUS19790 [Hexamita inflata]